MTLPKASIVLANGEIGGTQATNDGVVGVIGTRLGTTLALTTPMFVTSLEDAISKDITLADEPELYKIVKEFYDVDGTRGAKLYVMGVAQATSLVSIADKTNASGAKKLLDYANGEIKVLGLTRKPAEDYVPTTVQFIDSDAISAVTNAKALAAEYFAQIKPFRCLIGARVHDSSSTTYHQPKTGTANNVGMVLGGTTSDGAVSMGLVLGMIAASPVHRNIGRVKSGALPAETLYIGNKKVEESAIRDTLIDYGYITFQTYPQKSGYFISNDPMCVAENDDYSILARGRVIDKASVIAYQSYVEELKDDVELIEGGKLDPNVIAQLEAKIENNISLGMSDSISGDPVAYIDPNQNLAPAGSKLKVKLRLKPKGYLTEIEVDLGFSIA